MKYYVYLHTTSTKNKKQNTHPPACLPPLPCKKKTLTLNFTFFLYPSSPLPYLHIPLSLTSISSHLFTISISHNTSSLPSTILISILFSNPFVFSTSPFPSNSLVPRGVVTNKVVVMLVVVVSEGILNRCWTFRLKGDSNLRLDLTCGAVRLAVGKVEEVFCPRQMPFFLSDTL
jgi:hypothetical protein